MSKALSSQKGLSVEITTLVPASFDEAKQIAKSIAPSTLLPAQLRGKEPELLMTILAGRELGIPPMAAVRAFHVIEGIPRLSADAMVASCLASRLAVYFRQVELTDESSTWETLRKGHESPSRYTWTIADQRKIGMRQGSGWEKYPKRMLAARAKSFLARDVYPDLLAGMISAEEAQDETGLSLVDKSQAIEAIVVASASAAPSPAPTVPVLALTEAEEATISVLMPAIKEAESAEELARIHSSLEQESSAVFAAVAPHLYRAMIRAAATKRDLQWVAAKLKDQPRLKEELRDAYKERSDAIAAAAAEKKP